ncbi:MAG: NAD-dependent epimerase/dehydratase family protein [Chthoniobacterales bacterium]
MKILVTGGSGFIGSHIVEHYQGQAEIVVLDNFRTGRRSNLGGLDCKLVEGSILDRELVDSLMQRVDVVFHLAALVSVPESVEKPAETVEINVQGLLNVLESARHANVKKLCFASSAAVYGEIAESPKVETMTPDPRSPYAITKLDGEYYCDFYARQGWLDTACLRFFNVFGPRQDPGSAYAAAVPIFIQRALDKKPVNIYGDGEQTRDFIYVKDIVGALIFLAHNTSLHGVFNAGYGSSQTINTLAKNILKQIEASSEIIYSDPRPGDIRHSVASAKKLLDAGWKPRFKLEEAISETVRSMRVCP